MEDCFEHPNNLAFEVMLHHTFNLALFGSGFYDSLDQPKLPQSKQEILFDYLTSTDEELLIRLDEDGPANGKNIACRIRYRDPFTFVAKIKFGPDHGVTPRELRVSLSKASVVSPSKIGIRTLPGFGRRHLKQRTREWLDLERLVDLEGQRIVDGKYHRQIEHFKAVQDDVKEPVWSFGSDDSAAKKLTKGLRVAAKQLHFEIDLV